jgi:NADH:ubiquinone oxidoreductase subunit 6 (subunit J)
VTIAVTFILLAALALTGAAFVVLSRDALRLVVGLGTFLLAGAGFYAYYGMGFLAVAQVFVYVGGVLVLLLFALMLLGRDASGKLLAPVRLDAGAAVLALALFGLLSYSLGGVRPQAVHGVAPAGVGAFLLGPMLPAFELLGALLLAALVAVLVIVGGGERS